MPINGLTIATDWDRFQFGAEYILASRVSFHAGIQQGLDNNNERDILVPSAGLSLKFKNVDNGNMGLKATLSLNPTHLNFHQQALSPAVVSITKTLHCNLIFRSLHRYYESELHLLSGSKNISDADLPVDVSLFVPTMMDNPHSEAIILPPKSEEEYDIGISFSSDVLTSKKATFDNLVYKLR